MSGLCNSFPKHWVCTLLLLIFKLFDIGIRTALLESDDHTCPTCHQNDVSPDALIANKFLRQVNYLCIPFLKKFLKFLII